MSLLATLVLAPFTLLTFCFAVELFVGLRPIRRIIPAEAPETAVVLVPAHDEEKMVGDTLPALIAAAADHAKVLVVADNCTDQTAAAVRALGVEAIERADPTRRGKGFALDFARTHLRRSPPDLVLVLDADCRLDAESLRNLIAACAASARPCQAVNLQRPDPTASPAVQLSSFAFFIKNVVRQRALQRLAGRAHLLGTGMAFPWPIFERAALATDNIAEDLEMGIELAEAGHQPLFVEEASVWSTPETETNTLVQRRRWEGGFLKNALSAAPRLFRRALAAGDVRGLWAATNLFIPPLALLILFDLVALMLGVLLAVLGGASLWPVGLLAISLLASCAGLALAWTTGGRQFVTLGSLVRIPAYILWKLPMYLGFARRGAPKEWIRTRGS